LYYRTDKGVLDILIVLLTKKILCPYNAIVQIVQQGSAYTDYKKGMRYGSDTGQRRSSQRISQYGVANPYSGLLIE